MKFSHVPAAGVALMLMCIPANAQHRVETIPEILSDTRRDFDRPAERARAVERIRAIENAGLAKARERANAMGIPMRSELPDGTVTEVVGIDDDGELLIYTTHNANAAISTAANLLHPAPYDLDGTGITVGVWDGGDARNTHQEFGSRVTVKNGVGFNNHATHVTGTIAAAGVSASRKGMAPGVLVDSYHWGSDTSEMTAAAADSPQQAGKINISNHSYGFVTGWRRDGSKWKWSGTGTDQNAFARQFGQYTGQAATWDSIAYNAPYYLIFKSAGNDNNNNPSPGSQVIIGGETVTYDPAIHPPGDGLYRNTTSNPANGYENISHAGNSKNIMTVGAANDAVTSGMRDPSKSSLANFSSRGPTDDGRIKPDIVANGVLLSSTSSSSDTSYTGMSGTSMSSPNAAGSAALLVQLYRDLFPGGDMRASTLKGLIIHTATDLGEFGLGNPGPDYHYGWGLMDTHKAADLIINHHANPEASRMIEDQLDTSTPSQTHTFTWDGESPIRATLCWTDPAGESTTAHDSRISRLVNDLDMRIIAPDGTQHYPFVMPFVGTWTVESMSLPATTGDNHTDNVEQIRIDDPGQQGTWQIVITHKGALTNNHQHYSLVTSGLSAAPVSMEVARGGDAISVGGVDGVSGAAVGSGTQLTYAISNTGGGQLELDTPVAISGEQNCSVTVNTQPASPVDGGASINLVTTVTPATEGSWSFNVSIANNDPDKDPYHWTVTGLAGSSAAVSFTPEADTYIDNTNAGSNFGSATDIRINNQSGGNPNNRLHMQGLLRFDLSSIPSGTTVESATLDFVQNNSASGSFEIFEVTGAWSENGATWDNSSGLFGGNVFGTASMPESAGSAIPSIGLNAAGLSRIQDWVDNPSGNHGFGIIAEEMGNSQNWFSIRSREHPTEADHPRLTLTLAGGSFQAPLMIVSGDSGFVANGGSDEIPDTEEETGAELTYTIENLGNADLSMTTPVTATAVSNCAITVNTQPSSPVAASGSTDLVLTVIPTAAGSWSATVSIANNDQDRDPYTWTITGSATGTFPVAYDGNGEDDGNAPLDPESPYLEGSTVTVLDNTGTLIRDGFTFVGWNTAADGSEDTYQPGDAFTMPPEPVTLYAMWNAAPEVDAGPDQTVYLSGSSPWTPGGISSIVAWFDASDADSITQSGGAVSQWDDKSGNGNHATQGTASQRPTYRPGDPRLNDLPTIGYDQSYKFLQTPSIDAIQNAYVVTYYDDPDDTFDSHRVLFSNTGNDRKLQGVIGGSDWVSGNGFDKYRDGANASSDANALPMGPTLWTARGTASHTDMVWRILGGASSWQYWEHGAVGEIIFTDGSEDLATRRKIEGYLAWKWGTQENLPGDHPYKDGAPGSPTAVVELAGMVNDPDEDPLTHQWTKEDGPPATVEFDDPAALDTTATLWGEGVYTLRLTADDGFQQAYDEVRITVEAEPLPTVASFAITGVPSQVNVDTAVTGITIKALDAEADIAASFTGTVTYGGTAGITGTSAEFVDGVLENVSITPTLIGSDMTFTVDDAAGHVGGTSFNVVSAPYSDWAGENNLTGEEADIAAILQPDGLTNLQKFAHGIDPAVPSFNPLEFDAQGEITALGTPTLANLAPPGSPDDERAVFARRKDHAETGLIYTVRFSADLREWTVGSGEPEILTQQGGGGDYEVVGMPFPAAVPVEGGGDARPPKFMRVFISLE